MKTYDKTIFEVSRPGRRGYELPRNEFKGETLKNMCKRHIYRLCSQASF